METTKKFNSHEILLSHYIDRIRSEWRWNKIVQDAMQNPRTDEFGEVYGSTWLGNTLGIYPSGKIYTFWTSNQTSSDIRRDEAFSEALEALAKEHGGFIEHEDDSVFFAMRLEGDDETACEAEDIANGQHDSDIF